MGLFNRKKQKPENVPEKTVQASTACAQGHEARRRGDYASAAALYRKAMEEGDPAGCNALGTCYYRGTGVEKDIRKAVELYKQAAEAGIPAAQVNLAIQYKNGNVVEKNYEKALFWYEKAAEQGNVQAQLETANIYTGTYDKALCNASRAALWYEKAAEQGDAFAQYAIGDAYLKGNGTARDLVKARHWLQLSAEQGNEFGQMQLANTYDAENNGEKYIYWLTKAAEQGLGEAQCNLGVEYVTAKYIEKDLQKAMYWLEKAKENQIPQAAGALAEIQKMIQDEQREAILKKLDADQLYSIGMNHYHDKDYKNAFPYVEKAAQMELPEAQAMLGIWYTQGIEEEGHATEADLEKAQYWMEKAAQQDVPNAKEALRDIIRVRAADDYNTGIHKIKDRVVDRSFGTTIEDFSEAAPYLEKAGEIGLVEAQVILASHYLYGECDCISKLRFKSFENFWAGENIHTAMGMYWLKKAVSQEDPNSMFIYAKCLLFGPENLGSVSEVLFESDQADASLYPDTKKAFDMAVKAANLGCDEAASWLSKAEKNHLPGASEALHRTKSYQDWEEKERRKNEWWEKEGGRLEDLFKTGQEYYENKDYKKAVPYFQEAAEQGHKTAQQRLAYCYSHGFGIEKDEEKSDYWFLKSMGIS